jgi:hypothetical protein
MMTHLCSARLPSTGNGIPPFFNEQKSLITSERMHFRMKHIQTANMKVAVAESIGEVNLVMRSFHRPEMCFRHCFTNDNDK